jgi:hypothetical protein
MPNIKQKNAVLAERRHSFACFLDESDARKSNGAAIRVVLNQRSDRFGHFIQIIGFNKISLRAARQSLFFFPSLHRSGEKHQRRFRIEFSDLLTKARPAHIGQTKLGHNQRKLSAFGQIERGFARLARFDPITGLIEKKSDNFGVIPVVINAKDIFPVFRLHRGFPPFRELEKDCRSLYFEVAKLKKVGANNEPDQNTQSVSIRPARTVSRLKLASLTATPLFCPGLFVGL